MCCLFLLSYYGVSVPAASLPSKFSNPSITIIKGSHCLTSLSKLSHPTMDAKFRALPPLKRFTLLQQQQHTQLHPERLKEQPHDENASIFSFQLPAKKRKESRDALLPDPTCFLPTKKRVWALHPDLISGKPLTPFDLNVEYNPASFGEQTESVASAETNKTQVGVQKHQRINDTNPRVIGKIIHQEKIGGNEEAVVEDDDDGVVCAICGSTDGDPTDPIVFCDGCDLMVHATCYGNPLLKGIPEDEWFCSQCLVSQSNTHSAPASLSCCLCPVKGGAMKSTTDNPPSWAHVVCALFVPEVFFKDPDGRDGIDCSKVPRRRWEGRCYLCKSDEGCVIECSEPKCPLAFHATCGLKEDLCIEYRDGKKKKKKKETIVAGFCKSHTELWETQQQTGKFKIVARDECRK